jgi:hypothetical protein
MSQGLRDMLANRRFAIPLMVLLAFCFIGLILVGVVLILRPGAPDGGEPVAQATSTQPLEPTALPTSTRAPTDTPTPRPTPTLVPLGTEVSSSGGTPVSSVGEGATPTGAAATTAATEESTPGAATATPQTEEELAQTGVGWGLILFSGVGLAILVLVARRLRLAQ